MKTKYLIQVIVKNIIVVLGAFLGGFYFTNMFHEPTSLVGGLWATISAIIVLEVSHYKTLSSAKLRLTGSFIGAVLSGIYMLLFPFSVIGFAATIGIGVLVCFLLKVPEAIKLTGITVSVIIIVSTISEELHPIKNAGLRFIESAIGAGIAELVAYVNYKLGYFPHHKKDIKNKAIGME